MRVVVRGGGGPTASRSGVQSIEMEVADKFIRRNGHKGAEDIPAVSRSRRPSREKREPYYTYH